MQQTQKFFREKETKEDERTKNIIKIEITYKGRNYWFVLDENDAGAGPVK